MKTVGGVFVVLSLLIAAVPQFTNCQADGRTLTLASGKEIPMKCYWTARAELALGLPLVVTGALIFASRRKETLRTLGIIGAGLGIPAILLPTWLIGVCMNPDMICVSTMRPALILLGSVVTLLGVGTVVYSVVGKDEPAPIPMEEGA
jgi:hypothetical protein